MVDNDVVEAGFRYELPVGDTFEEMRENVRKTDLYQRGDTVLVWVNEADLNPLSAQPTSDLVQDGDELTRNELLERFNTLLSQKENTDTCTTYSGKIQEIGALFCDNRSVVRLALKAALSAQPAIDDENEVVALLDELLDGPTKGAFYGIGSGLRNKLETIRLTALRSDRNAVVEECAKVADRVSIKASTGQSSFSQGRMAGADEVAEQIRSLKDTEQ